ncbi:TetR/AcrR family transcriptional regulator [Reyranella sp. CPCC 100927]|nr:TetR/AcrR family transcriptional regulator [Reyranella sp. CPCC 100927]
MDQAVATALKLFHARGYDAVGVAELVSAFGITPPSFYAAFGSKAGLFARVLERYAKSEADLFTHARAKGGSVTAVIGHMLARAAEIYPACDGTAGCLVLDGARNSADPDARALTAAIKQAAHDTLRDFIATQYPQQADALSKFVEIALAGMSAAARDGADRPTLEAFAASMTRTFRREAKGA